jgi:hypothetical protein
MSRVPPRCAGMTARHAHDTLRDEPKENPTA